MKLLNLNKKLYTTCVHCFGATKLPDNTCPHCGRNFDKDFFRENKKMANDCWKYFKEEE